MNDVELKYVSRRICEEIYGANAKPWEHILAKRAATVAIEALDKFRAKAKE